MKLSKNCERVWGYSIKNKFKTNLKKRTGLSRSDLK